MIAVADSIVAYSWRGAIERKWIEELPVPKKLAFCLRQCSFVADASPIQPDRVDLMLDKHLGGFCIKQEALRRL
jgi:hypothetical protein